jgi:RNA polymerase sigma factor (sigma-70 family)
MVARFVRECDCGWTSVTCTTASDARRLGQRHGCVQSGDDWLLMAGAIVKRMRIRGPLMDEAVQEAAMAGWIAAEKWSPDGGMSRRNWIWRAMERGLVDWVRQRMGRTGRRHEWDVSVRYLDGIVAGEDLTLGATLAFTEDGFAAVERDVDLSRLIARAGLRPREARWVEVLLAELPQNVLMDEWGVSEGRVSQVKRETLAKLRAAA